MNQPVALRAPGKELALATACRDLVGAGGKGGSNARTPVETPDSLRSIARARILDFIAEGELRGLVARNQSIYLDQVPIQNADGTLNFQGVRVETRSGTQDQTHIAGFPSVENEIAVNVELRSDSPVVRTATGSDLSAVRVRLAVPALQKVDTSNGDTVGYSISYAIDLSTNGGPYATVLTSAFTDKTTTQYERSHRIDLPAGTQWQVRIRRLTPNANSSTISDTVNVLSMTEVIDAGGPITRRGRSSTGSPTTGLALGTGFRWTGLISGGCTRSPNTAISWSATARAKWSRGSPAACTCRPALTPTACCRTWRPSSAASASMLQGR